VSEFFESLGEQLVHAVETRSAPRRRELVMTALVAALALAIGGVLLVSLRPAGHRAAAPRGAPFPGAPASQHFSQFGTCPLAPPNRYLPRGASCVTVRRADVDGDGRADLVLLYARGGHFRLDVRRAAGGRLHARVGGDRNATVEIARDVNSVPGVELFLYQNHVTTAEYMGIYTFDGSALRQAGTVAFGGHDAGIRFGVVCHRRPPPSVVQLEFQERMPFRGVWDRTVTTYAWDGARLRRAATGTDRAAPTPGQLGVHC
jgi:hypothetical protein